jgi:putative PIN family toxin of toxin-antitoxin system
VIRVVLDTNVLLSAILHGGNPERVLGSAWEGKIQPLSSPALLMELVNVLKMKFHCDPEDIRKAVQIIGYSVELIKPVHRIRVLGDDSDNRVLECAVEGRANDIVSGDGHLLALGDYQRIPILKPAALLSRL